MGTHTRDATLAGVGLTVLLGLLRRRGALGAVRDPWVALGGTVTALLVEGAFLRSPERLLAWWERPVVNRGALAALCGGAVIAQRRPRLLAAGVWGLATYFGLLLWLSGGPPSSQQDT